MLLDQGLILATNRVLSLLAHRLSWYAKRQESNPKRFCKEYITYYKIDRMYTSSYCSHDRMNLFYLLLPATRNTLEID